MFHHGHAPGHIRETFLDAVDAFMAWNDGEPEPTVEFEVRYVPRQIPISKACSLVWNCTDVVPGVTFNELADVLDIKRHTYAACARAMLAKIKLLS